jgi:hypothetical protein
MNQMPDRDQEQRDERIMASLRAYGAVLDRAAEAAPSTAPVAELVAAPPRYRPTSRSVLAAAAVVAVFAAGVSVLAARDRDMHSPKVRTTHSSGATAPSTTTTVPAPSFLPANVVVATAEGVLRFDSDGKGHRVVEGSVVTAVSDTTGGVVFQRTEQDTTLWHLPAGATEPVALVRATGGEWLELWDVATMNGDVVVVYSRHDAPSPQDGLTSDKPGDHLQVTGLATGDTRTIAKVGGWEWGATAISAGGDRFALNAGAEISYRFDFRNIDGTVVRVPGNPFDDAARFPQGDCPDDPTCPTTVAIAADGKRFAYIEPVGGTPGDYRVVVRDYRIVVVDSTTGEKVGTVAVHFPQTDQDSGIWVRSLDLTDDGTVIVNWRSTGVTTSTQKPLVADLESGQVSTMSVVGTARAG